jgi:hypothetical protein
MDDSHPVLRVRPFSTWPLAWTVGVPLFLIGFDATPLGTQFAFAIRGIAIFMGLWALAALVAAYGAARGAVRGQWRSAGVASVLPVRWSAMPSISYPFRLTTFEVSN